MPKPSRALTLILSAMPSEIRLIQGRMDANATSGTLAVFPYKRGVLNGRPVVTTVTVAPPAGQSLVLGRPLDMQSDARPRRQRVLGWVALVVVGLVGALLVGA